MEFEWDEFKSEACFQKRGFDFAYAAQAFGDPDRTIDVDSRRDYGEERFRLTGNIRIISAHKANQREIKRYEDGAHED